MIGKGRKYTAREARCLIWRTDSRKRTDGGERKNGARRVDEG